MAQDTRKDPRAKVLSMTVRYKSATVDEFIEHHAQDVSRGGIFIKTPSPFPPGTLLKFEIRLQDEQAVIAGVGRVVWKRESAQATDSTPSGMGVKFIKIDDKSKALISRIVEQNQNAGTAFETGGGEGGAPGEGEERERPLSTPPSPASRGPATRHLEWRWRAGAAARTRRRRSAGGVSLPGRRSSPSSLSNIRSLVIVRPPLR